MGGRMRAVGAVVIAFSAVMTGCSSSEKKAPTVAAPDAAVPAGGTLVVGAAQEPACADWYAPCGNNSWGFDMMATQTLPRTFDFVDGRYRPSALLAAEPTLEPGPPQRVTYRLDARAVWSDGQPITSADLRFTVDQAKAAAYAPLLAVAAVDDSDPHTAVVTHANPDPAWRDGFSRGILPKHLLDGKNRTDEMRNGYGWSGGPWVIDHWTKGQDIKLTPNPTYWGKRPNLDAVLFKVITDSAAHLAAFKTGQIDVAFVEGPSADVLELKSLPDTRFEVTASTGFEFVMFNTAKSPLDSRAVRQALAYATDRDAIVGQLYGWLDPGLRATQAFMSPANRQWYSEPFAVYRRDLARVTQLMTGDGWSRGPDGIWAKGGSHAMIELNAASGNRRRELTEQILQSQWKDAGFATVVNNPAQQVFTGEWIPKGMFTAGLFGMVPPSTDPNLCRQFCSQSIPTEANGFQGANTSRLSSRALDAAWQSVATELDDAKRVELVRRAHQALADEVPGLPISGGVNVTVFNSAKVGGPVQANPLGRAFHNLQEWYCQTCR